ncbi:MAG: amino acid ABC transporter permease [Candidatus Mcinerneyibacterium aminivorans]|uniref:Amino acid ABC transporter permease n=1 Tax=Candidatus Mcinerneyibacterium aminivorans TaxID=2703815 RepID=A0A5D0MBS9_9BACT|nr:MAG: amino acid ABC transporter permease [Candidatus Mcinerneyibacterium aminivorans]
MIESILFVFENMPLLLKGALVAVELTVLSILLGMVVGLLVAILRLYGPKYVKKLMKIYEWVLRGLPILVILFIIYFGFPSLGVNIPAFISAVLGLGLRSSAYQAQIYRGAIQSIGVEQVEAGLSIGMNRAKTMLYVIVPQAIRLSLPGFTNEFTIVLKDSPLAYALGIAELLKQGRNIIVTSFRPFTIYLTCAIIYFLLFHFFYYLFRKIAEVYEVPGYIMSKKS